jgi:hypothetical protein
VDIWETEVLNTIYRESKLGLQAIHNVIGKVYDEKLALDLNKQAAKYSKLEEKAATRLIENGKVPRSIRPMEKARMWTSMQANMVLNTSTGHVAEMIIKENATEITPMEKARMWTSMQANMVLNTSTGHVAEMIIKENATEITDVLKAVKRHKNISTESMEMADELMDFSEKNIQILKSYRKS